MRLTLITAAAFTTLFAGSLAASAQSGTAQNYRYCAEAMDGTSSAGKPSCLYRTMEECREAVKGDQDICTENPATRSK